MLVRMAVPGDAAGVRDVHLRSWIAAYSGLLPHEELERLYEQPAAYDWGEMIAMTTAGWVLVIEAGERIIGFSHFGASDRERDVDGWLHRLYVEPEKWGTDAARLLHNASLTRLRESGFRIAGLHVLKNNQRARRFYEREGWRLDPDDGLTYAASIPDVSYRYRLADGPDPE